MENRISRFFQAVSASLKAQRVLMIADSLDHEIAGTQVVG